MLSILGHTTDSRAMCDRISRRRAIHIGALGAFGLSLPDLVRAETAGLIHPGAKSRKSVILVWMHGGPSQLDTFDMKPNAPAEFRGPFQPIGTSLPGLDICELLPAHAKVMDKCTVIRSFSHGNGDHWAAAHWMLTGRTGANGSDRKPRYPSMGAVASQLLGPKIPGSLAAVNMNDGGFGFHGAAWLGVNHNPLQYGSFSYGNEAGSLPTSDAKSFALTDGLSEKRLIDRVSLRSQLDDLKRRVDRERSFDQMDKAEQQAMDLVLSGKVRKAFDVSEEPQALRDRYGAGWGEQALMARRLVEAGVRYVSLNTGYFDDHGNIGPALKDKLPRHDAAVGTLIADLADKGLLDDTLVVVAGEFGHTPKINKDAGRDHWPNVYSTVLAGGGVRGGVVYGASDSKGAEPADRPVTPADVLATVYDRLGIPPNTELRDRLNRPMQLSDGTVLDIC